MASKSDKEKKPIGKTNPAPGKDSVKKPSSKPKKDPEDDDNDDEPGDVELEETPASRKAGKPAASSKKGKSAEDDDDDDEGEVEPDEWEKPVEEEEWDPDFEEFDIPKSKVKKTGTGKKAGTAAEEDDFKFEDEEFKDLFNDKGYDDEEEEDY